MSTEESTDIKDTYLKILTFLYTKIDDYMKIIEEKESESQAIKSHFDVIKENYKNVEKKLEQIKSFDITTTEIDISILFQGALRNILIILNQFNYLLVTVYKTDNNKAFELKQTLNRSISEIIQFINIQEKIPEALRTSFIEKLKDIASYSLNPTQRRELQETQNLASNQHPNPPLRQTYQYRRPAKLTPEETAQRIVPPIKESIITIPVGRTPLQAAPPPQAAPPLQAAPPQAAAPRAAPPPRAGQPPLQTEPLQAAPLQAAPLQAEPLQAEQPPPLPPLQAETEQENKEKLEDTLDIKTKTKLLIELFKKLKDVD